MNNAFYVKYLFLAVIPCLVLTSEAQSTENITSNQPINIQGKTDNKIKELWALFDHVYFKMQAGLKNNSDKHTISQILNKKCDVNWDNDFQLKALLADADSLQSNKGLSIRGGYTTQDLNNSINDSDGNSYVELSWDILKGGYKDYEHRATSVRRQATIQKLEGELKQLNLDYRCRNHTIAQQFLGIESSLISLKLELMEPVYEIEKKAYFSGWSYLDELLISEEDIRQARQQLEHINNNPYLEDMITKNINPPVIDIDLFSILKQIKNDPRKKKIVELEKQNIIDHNDYQDGSQFRLFLRKEFVNNNFETDGMVAGLRFSIPFSDFENKSNVYKSQQITTEASYAAWERITRTRSAYEQLHEQLERVTKRQYQYLRNHEKIRRIQARQSLNQELELAVVIARMRTFIDSGIELVRAKKELYRRVNLIFRVAGIEYSSRLIKINQLKSTDYRARIGDRAIYLWSKRFNAMSNSQILNFLVTKGIKTVLLSTGKKIDKIKKNVFISSAKEKGINVESIVGSSNDWVYPQNHLKATTAIVAATEINSAVHLDIEPQAILGTKEEKLANLDHYMELLRSVRSVSQDHYISIAVPFHWPEASYQVIHPLVDKLYVMAYGTDKIDTIVRRVNNILNQVPLKKIVVVLRVDDFENEWKMEKVIEDLQQVLGINNFAFHKLDSFIKQQGF